MFYIDPTNYDPALTSCIEFLDRRKRPTIAAGHTQKDKARSEGITFGYANGYSFGLAAMLTGRRTLRYPKLSRVNMLTETEVNSEIIRPAIEKWASMGLGDRDVSRDELETVRHQFIGWLRALLDSVTYTEELDAAELQRHRKAVLAEEEPATADDREWLIKEMNEAREAWGKLRNLDPELAEFAERARPDTSGDTDT